MRRPNEKKKHFRMLGRVKDFMRDQPGEVKQEMNYRDASIRGIYYIPKSKTNCEV